MDRALMAMMLIVASLAAAPMSDAAPDAGTEPLHYRATRCIMPNDDLTLLTFLGSDKRSRRISFSAKGQFSAVYLGYFTDIAIDWNRIIAIHSKAYDHDPSLALFLIEFKPDTRIEPSPFEFGLVSRTCVRNLAQRYGSYLKFVED